MEQPAHGLEVWMQPLVPLRAPKLFNLRSDPFERAEHEAGDYVKWFVEHVFVLVPAQAIVAQHLQHSKSFRRGRSRAASRSTRPWKSLRARNPAISRVIVQPKGGGMNRIVPLSGVNRRVLLSALAALPSLSGTLLSVSASAQTRDGRATAAVLE